MHGDGFLDAMVADIFKKYDRSHDGVIQFDEFREFIWSHTHTHTSTHTHAPYHIRL